MEPCILTDAGQCVKGTFGSKQPAEENFRFGEKEVLKGSFHKADYKY
jgi:hypothetical protein